MTGRPWQSYDSVAREYDRAWYPSYEPVARDLLELVALEPNEAMLDVGTGTGVVAAGPTPATRSASMMTVTGVSGGRPVPSIKVAPTTASFGFSGINWNREFYHDVEGQTSTLTNRVIHTSA